MVAEEASVNTKKLVTEVLNAVLKLQSPKRHRRSHYHSKRKPGWKDLKSMKPFKNNSAKSTLILTLKVFLKMEHLAKNRKRVVRPTLLTKANSRCTLFSLNYKTL